MAKSKAIKTISYNEDRQDLTVRFKSNKEYVYTPVSEEHFLAFGLSTSKGKFFNAHIKDNPIYTVYKKL